MDWGGPGFRAPTAWQPNPVFDSRRGKPRDRLENRGARVTCFEHQHGLTGALAAKQVRYLGGSRKSGAAWLQLLLDAHPAMARKGKGQVVNHLAKPPTQDLGQHNHRPIRKRTACPPNCRRSRSILATIRPIRCLGVGAVPGQGRSAGKDCRHRREGAGQCALFRCVAVDLPLRPLHPSGRRTCPDRDVSRYGALDRYAAMFARQWAKDLAHASAFASAHPDACIDAALARLSSGRASG